MEEEMLSKILPKEKVLEKIKDFYLKCQDVNSSYELYLKTKKEVDIEAFKAKWVKLNNEDSHYFRALSIADSDWPSKKSYLIELKTDTDVLITESVFPGKDEPFEPFKMPARKNKITKVQIAYGLCSNQGDCTPESEFPFFGMYLMLMLGSERTNFICVATANTKKGYQVISSPAFNTVDLTITTKEKEIKFENDEPVRAIIDLMEEHLKIVNEAIGEEAFVNNIKFN